MDSELFYQGSERAIHIYGGCDGFNKWAEKLNRPPIARLIRTIEWIANLPFADLKCCGNIWKHVPGSNPKLFEIRKEQVRVYCCHCRGGIVMLHWVVKKQNRASKSDLQVAERRAKKVLQDERNNEEVDCGVGGNS